MMTFEGAHLERAIERIQVADDIDALWLAVKQFGGANGFSHVTYRAMKIPSLGIYNNISFSTIPVEFHDYYKAQRYHEIDPVILFGARRLLPFDWADLEESTPVTRRVTEECRAA